MNRNRIVLITGGNKGLGYESARRLLEMGYKVYIGSRNEERGKMLPKNRRRITFDGCNH